LHFLARIVAFVWIQLPLTKNRSPYLGPRLLILRLRGRRLRRLRVCRWQRPGRRLRTYSTWKNERSNTRNSKSSKNGGDMRLHKGLIIIKIIPA
jgi:hypothetical protein